MDRSALEYEEDDLFGSDEEVNTAKAIEARSVPLLDRTPSVVPHGSRSADHRQPAAGPSKRPDSLHHLPGRTATGAFDKRQRQEELRQKRVPAPVKRRDGGLGPPSLRDATMAVVRANANRIWDIGDLEYSTIATFINELPRDQLAEIEDASPHIKKDTDWLWEYWLLLDFPLFYEGCKDRKGAHRSTGWRRMYKAAKEDVEERKAQAQEKLAQRYRELEEQKASKRIVQVDKLGPTKRKRGFGAPKPSGSSASQSSSFTTAPRTAAGAIARAKAEVQRTRLALTHATGKYIPPPPSMRPKPAAVAHNPFLESKNASPLSLSRVAPVMGPRIPPPRSKVTAVKPDNRIIPGAYKANDPIARSALPQHLTTAAQSQLPSDTAERRASPDRAPRSAGRKFDVPVFQPPAGTMEKRPRVDFFSKGGEAPPIKKPKPDGVATLPTKPAAADASSRTQKAPARDLSSVLFRKRPKPKPPGHVV